MRIRRSVYVKLGQPISLAYLACIADSHPEVAIEAASPPQPKPQPPALARAQQPSRWSEKLTRRRNRASERMARALNRIGYEATMRRIDRGGV